LSQANEQGDIHTSEDTGKVFHRFPEEGCPELPGARKTVAVLFEKPGIETIQGQHPFGPAGAGQGGVVGTPQIISEPMEGGFHILWIRQGLYGRAALPAALAAIADLLPVFLPLFPPGKGTVADWADLLRQEGLSMHGV
jgi:hypothetical protein